MDRRTLGFRVCAWASVLLLAGSLAPAVLAGPGPGDRVDWLWQVGGQVLCFKVTNLAPKGTPIWDFHVHRSSGSMIIAGIFSSPGGWAGSASPPDDAKWVSTSVPIKMKGSAGYFCVAVGGGGGMKIQWSTTDRSGGILNSGYIDVAYP